MRPINFARIAAACLIASWSAAATAQSNFDIRSRVDFAGPVVHNIGTGGVAPRPAGDEPFVAPVVEYVNSTVARVHDSLLRDTAGIRDGALVLGGGPDGGYLEFDWQNFFRGGTDPFAFSTMEFWVERGAAADDQVLIDIDRVRAQNGARIGRLTFFLHNAATGPQLILEGTGGASWSGALPSALPVGQLTHLVLQVKPGVAEIWVDGVLAVSFAHGFNLSTEPQARTTAFLGARIDGGYCADLVHCPVRFTSTPPHSRNMTGRVLEMRSWERSLTPEEIANTTALGPDLLPSGEPYVVHQEFNVPQVNFIASVFGPHLLDTEGLRGVRATGFPGRQAIEGGNRMLRFGSADVSDAQWGGTFSTLTDFTLDLTFRWQGSGRQKIFGCDGGLDVFATDDATAGPGFFRLQGQTVPAAVGGAVTSVPQAPFGQTTQLTITVDPSRTLARVWVDGELAAENTSFTAVSTALAATTSRCAFGGGFVGSVNSFSLLGRSLVQPYVELLGNRQESRRGPVPEVLLAVDTVPERTGGTLFPQRYPQDAVAFVNNATIDLGGVHANRNGTTTTVTWSNDRGGMGTGTLSGEQHDGRWSITGVPMHLGVNRVTVEARDASDTVLATHSVELHASDVQPPQVTITSAQPSRGPAPALTTVGRHVTVRGSAGDDFGVQRVQWTSTPLAGGDPVSGFAIGSDGTLRDNTDESWRARVPLRPGLNRIDVVSMDTFFPSPTQSIVVERAADSGLELLIDGLPATPNHVLTPGSEISVVWNPAFDIEAVHVQLGDVLLPGVLGATSWIGGLAPSMFDRAAPVQLAVFAEHADGIREDGPTASVEVATGLAAGGAALTEQWVDNGPLPGGLVAREVSVAPNGSVWVVAGEPLGVTSTDSAEVVGDQIRYVTELTFDATRELLLWDGSSWHRYTPTDLGLPGAVLTDVEAFHPTNAEVWVGSDQGVARLGVNTRGTPPTLLQLLDSGNGLYGDHVDDIALSPLGDLVVCGRATRWHRLNLNAVRRYLENPGGVSVVGSTLRGVANTWVAETNDLLEWQGPEGFATVACDWNDNGDLWVGSELGLSGYVSGSWLHFDPDGGMPFSAVADLAVRPGAGAWVSNVDPSGPGAAFFDFSSASWSAVEADTARNLPSNTILDIAVDDENGKVWFATASGLASLDDALQWTEHPEPGAATALDIGPLSQLWTAGDTLFAVDLSLRVTLTAPAHATWIASGDGGSAAALLEWDPVTGADAYEVSIEGIPTRRVNGTTLPIDLLPGTVRWSVRAIFDGGTPQLGPAGDAFSLTVADARVRGDAEFLLSFIDRDLTTDLRFPEHELAGRVLAVRSDSAARGSLWTTYRVDPELGTADADTGRFVGSASTSGALGGILTPGAGGDSRFAQVPDVLTNLLADRPGDAFLLDRTSEREGLIWAVSESGSFTLYNQERGFSDFDLSSFGVTGAQVIDVAGLADGVFAVLLRNGAADLEVKLFTRPSAFAALRDATRSDIPVPATARAIAGRWAGGFSVLTDAAVLFYGDAANPTLLRTDDFGDAIPSLQVPLTLDVLAPGREALDLAIDRAGRMFVLAAPSTLRGPAATSSAVVTGVPTTDGSNWTLVDTPLPVDADGASLPLFAVDTWSAARGFVDAEPVPYNPPPPPNPGDTPGGGTGPTAPTLLTDVGGVEAFTVLASHGFTGPPAAQVANVDGSGSEVYIEGFLRADLVTGDTLTVSANSITCAGSGCDLFLDYDSVYATTVDGFPSLAFPNGIPVVDGGFSIGLPSGAIAPFSGGAWNLDLLDLAPITPLSTVPGTDAVQILGMSDPFTEVSRTGIGIQGYFTTASLPGLDNLAFSHLLLGDFGESFHATLGQPELPGVPGEFFEGELTLVDGAGARKTFPSSSVELPAIGITGELNLQARAQNLTFDTARMFIPTGCGTPTCPEDFDIQINDLEIGEFELLDENDQPIGVAGGIRFSNFGGNLAGFLILTGEDVAFEATGPRPGLYAGMAELKFPTGDKEFNVTDFYAGPAGLRFEEVSDFTIQDFEFQLAGVDIDLDARTFSAGYASFSRDDGEEEGEGEGGAGGRSVPLFGGAGSSPLMARAAINDALRGPEEEPDRGLVGQVEDLYVPFGFFDVPPSDRPLASAMLLRIGAADDPDFAMCFGVVDGPEADESEEVEPEDVDEFGCPTEADQDFPLIFSEDEISIPPFAFVTRSPEFQVEFGGGRITKELVELGDVPEFSMWGTTVDLALSRLERRGAFYTQSGTFTRGAVEVGVEDFTIEFDPTDPRETRFSITGGSFKKGGIGFEFSNLEKLTDAGGTTNGFKSDVRARGFPILTDVEGFIELQRPNRFKLGITDINEVNLGPLRLKDISFKPRGESEIPPPSASRFRLLEDEIAQTRGARTEDDDIFFFTATVGYGTFPDVRGEIQLRNKKPEFLRMRGTFPAPGRPIAQGVFLQQIGGEIDFRRNQLVADVLLTAGPEIDFAPFVSDVRLVTARGRTVVSAAGYIRVDGSVRLLEGNGFGGYPVGNAEFITGRVYIDGTFRGYGTYFRGTVNLFGGVLDVGTEGWMWAQPGAPYHAALNGSMQVPSFVPVIGGRRFGSVSAALNGTFDPPTGAISGTVKIGEICIKFIGCASIRASFRISDSGFGASLARTDPDDLVGSAEALALTDGVADRRFDAGYRMNSGLDVLTNFRLLDAQSTGARATVLGTGTGEGDLRGAITTESLFFDVPEGVRDAIVRIDTTLSTGNATLSVRYPTGELFTPSNTPTLDQIGAVTAEEGLIPIFRRDVDVAGATTAESLQESVLFLRGPFVYEDEAALDDQGEPTGEVFQALLPSDLPAGTYEVIVESDGDTSNSTVEFLLGNRVPELEAFSLTEIGVDSYQLDWTAIDPDGDPTIARVHLGTDRDRPVLSYELTGENGIAVRGASSFEVDPCVLADQAISAPLHVFVSLDDGFDVDFHAVGIVPPCLDPKRPARVQNLVASLGEDSVRLYWDPLATPPAPGTRLVSYAVNVEEIGPEGSTSPIVSANVDIPEATSIGELPEAQLSEIFIPELVPGRIYQATVTAVAEEKILGAGEPLCACAPETPPQPGDLCYVDVGVPDDCDVPTDVVITHPGVPSAALRFQIVGTSVNNLPRFLNRPSNLIEVGERYASMVVIEDLDGEPVSLQLIDTDVPPPAGSRVGASRGLVPPLAGISITDQGDGRFLLTYDAIEADLGRHPLTLEARDPRGGVTLLVFDLEVVNFGQPDLEATFTTMPETTVLVGESFTYQPEVVGSATAADLDFRLALAPEGMTIDSSSGFVSFSPTPTDVGDHVVVVEVGVQNPLCDSCVSTFVGSQTFTLQVLANPFASFGALLSAVPGAIAVPAAGGVAEIDVTNLGTGSSLNWEAVVIEGAAWLSLGTDSGGPLGSGRGAPDRTTVTATANPDETPRTATVRFTATDLADDEPAIGSPLDIVVTQPGSALASLALAPTASISLPLATAGLDVAVQNLGTGDLDFTAVISSGSDWLAIDGSASGSADTTVELTFTANGTGIARTGTLRVVSPGIPGSPGQLVVTHLGADLALAGEGSPNRVFLEQANPLRLEVTNPTPLAAGGVLLLLEVPEASALDLGLSPGWLCPNGNQPGSVCRFSVGTLDAGASQTVVVTPVLTDLPPRGADFRVEIATQDDGAKGDDGAPDDNLFAFEREISPVIVTVGEPSGDSTSEEGDSVTFDVTANFTPTHEVVIPLVVSLPGEATVEPEMIVFEAGEPPPPVQVRVTGLDDLDLDDDREYRVQLEPAVSDDPNWRGLDAPDVELVNVDDETIVSIPTAGESGMLLLMLLLGLAGLRFLRQE